MLKAVTLDYWNTLFVDHNGKAREQRRVEILRDELAALGKTAGDGALHEAIVAGYENFDRVWHKEQRTPEASETVDVAFGSLGVRPTAEMLARVTDVFERLLLDLPPAVVPGVPTTLPRLAERYKLAIICDTGISSGPVLRELLVRHGLLRYFGYVYFSNEGGRSKPDPWVFHHVLDELGVAPQEAAHVGDMQRTDIAGAQGAGMLAVHFVGANDHDVPISTGDALVGRFDELPRALGNLMCPGC
jgi:HAD superfamily hydrolase (TIGR01549 family)